MAKRPYPCAKLYVGSTAVSSSSIDSSADCSRGSAVPTGTGCANLGDGSLTPVTSESASDSSVCVSSGGVSGLRRVHPQRDLQTQLKLREGWNDMDCPKDGSSAR